MAAMYACKICAWIFPPSKWIEVQSLIICSSGYLYGNQTTQMLLWVVLLTSYVNLGKLFNLIVALASTNWSLVLQLLQFRPAIELPPEKEGHLSAKCAPWSALHMKKTDFKMKKLFAYV